MAKGIVLNKVSKSFQASSAQVHALKEVSFELPRHENTVILGPSGCGKSTALRLIAGLELPDAGEVALDGNFLSRSRECLILPHARGLAMVFQDLALWPGMSVLENVVLGLAAKRLAKKESQERAMAALELCRIGHLKNRKPTTLSGGQQQRVALARALAVKPDYLLLDEPFSGLDLMIKLGLLDEIRELAGKNKMSVVLVTHDPFEAASLCKRAIVLEDGRVIEQGLLSELMRSPASSTLQTFKRHLSDKILSQS